MKFNTMQKSVLGLVVGFSLLASVSALAKEKKMMKKDSNAIGTAGCGLGYLVLGGHDLQIIASTLNSTGYQSFGITTGTSGCDAGTHDSAMINYIQLNKEVVQTDLARGQGESIEALADITGCKDHSVLANGLKERYQDIFPSQNASPANITESIKKVIQENPSLASTCGVMS